MALPDATVVVSTVTQSGHETAASELSSTVDGITYAPLDLWGATRRTAAAISPDVLVLEYAELWPNLLSSAKRAGATTILVNGRLSPRRMAAYRWLVWLAGSPLVLIDRLLMQTEGDALRAKQLGALAERVQVCGSTKIDDIQASAEPSAASETSVVPEGRWLVAGSTHAEDEVAVFAAFASLKRVDPTCRLLMVPRYPERAKAVQAESERLGWRTERLEGSTVGRADVVVVAVFGRLRQAYAAARLAIVGGSFGDRGGHNVLEPAAVGVAVLAGPDLSNNAAAAERLRGRGLIQVAGGSALAQVAVDVWTNDELRQSLGMRAQAAVDGARGAADRGAAAVLDGLGESATS